MSPIQFHLRPRSTSANAPFSVDYGSFRRQVGLSYVDRFFAICNMTSLHGFLMVY